MLIVNADDLGRNPTATDAILACHAARRITSTSAMVYMRDSERACQMVLDTGLDVGLHINFSEPFTGPTVPVLLLSHQKSVCRFLKQGKYALLFYQPFLRLHFRNLFQAQYAEFKRLYGREPSHFDGHQHLHLATNVLIDNLLISGTKVRRSFSFRAGQKSWINRCYRAAVDCRLKRNHRVTDFFFALAHHLEPDRLVEIIRLAGLSTVELMTHPEIQREYDFLMGDVFGRLISEVKLASYDEL